MFVEIYKGFSIHVEALPEDIHPRDSFDMEEAEMQELLERIDCGYLLWFCARVEARRNGRTLGEAYLGGCCYTDLQEFISEGGYYQDLRAEAVAEANRTIQNILREE